MNHRRVVILIMAVLGLSMLLLLGECRRPATPEPPEISSTPEPSKTSEIITPTETAITPTTPANTPTATPTIQEAYPLPIDTLQGEPTITGTGEAYPQPPNEGATPIIETPASGGYPAPVNTSTQPITQMPQGTQTQISQTSTPTASPEFIPPYPGASPYPTDYLQYPGPLPTTTLQGYPEPVYTFPPSGYPEPQYTSTSPVYPEPQYTSTSPVYPGPSTSTPQVTQTPAKYGTPTATPTIFSGVPTSPTPGIGTPRVTPTERPARPPLAPPPPGSSVTIWHSWGTTETAELQAIIQSFQRLYPDVIFSLQYIPEDELYNSYYEAAYLGQGPSILLGPAKWGQSLYKDDLITNLKPFVPANYLTSINPAALASGVYNEALISLPLSLDGMLMFRNKTLVDTAPADMEILTDVSEQATHGGNVGSYLERGSFFSSAGIEGLGGQLMDENGYPVFNDEHGLIWFDLLEAYDVAGAVTFNTNRDLDMFKKGRVGIIIDGSWSIQMLTQTIGAGKLAIDPWPEYGTGHMSGWVSSENIFLNTNTKGNNRFAALSFMGYLLDPNVQMHLAEVGRIPSVITTQPRDVLIQQAMVAFMDGVPYPTGWDDSLLNLYWSELDKAIRDVFEKGKDPASALQSAEDNITSMLDDNAAEP